MGTRRILVLEDDLILSRQLERVLGSRGYEVHATHSVAGFVARATHERFDACLLDVSLPDGSGLDAWDAVRTTQPGTVAIVMTANGTPEVRRRAEELSMRATLEKPLDISLLLSTIAPDARGKART